MPKDGKTLTLPEYDRMARELEAMSTAIRAIPQMNHQFAERLALLAKEMREDSCREYPEQDKRG